MEQRGNWKSPLSVHPFVHVVSITWGKEMRYRLPFGCVTASRHKKDHWNIGLPLQNLRWLLPYISKTVTPIMWGNCILVYILLKRIISSNKWFGQRLFNDGQGHEWPPPSSAIVPGDGYNWFTTRQGLSLCTATEFLYTVTPTHLDILYQKQYISVMEYQHTTCFYFFYSWAETNPEMVEVLK